MSRDNGCHDVGNVFTLTQNWKPACKKINISKKLALNQNPEENVTLNLSCSKCLFYINYNSNSKRCVSHIDPCIYDLSLKFDDDLHEEGDKYVYDITFKINYDVDGKKQCDELFRHKKVKVRADNKIIVFKQTFYLTIQQLLQNKNIFPEVWQFVSPSQAKDLIEEAEKIIKSNKFEISCDIRKCNQAEQSENVERHLSDDKDIREILLKHGIDSDVVICVGDKIFQVHKDVLSEKSPVFKLMFLCDDSESGDRVITITDFDPEIIEGLILYMYTDDTIVLLTDPIKLLAAAHRYELEDLESKCIEQITSSLNRRNVVDVLDLANENHLQDLRESTMNYVLKHEEDMIEEDSFRSFLCRDLSVETVVSTLKLCVKYDLAEVRLKALEFLNSHKSEIGIRDDFLNLSDSHPELMQEIESFVRSSLGWCI